MMPFLVAFSAFGLGGPSQQPRREPYASESLSWNIVQETYSFDWLQAIQEPPHNYATFTQITAPAVMIAEPSQILSEIRQHLNVSIGDLAKILLVSRPTVYAWMQPGSIIKPENRQRLDLIRQVAADLRQHCPAPPLQSLLQAPAVRGLSFVQLLTADTISSSDVQEATVLIARSHQAMVAKALPSLAMGPRAQLPTDEVRRNLARIGGYRSQ